MQNVCHAQLNVSKICPLNLGIGIHSIPETEPAGNCCPNDQGLILLSRIEK